MSNVLTEAAEAEKFAAEAEAARAQARKFNAEAEEREIVAEMTKLSLSERRVQLADVLASDERNHTYWFDGPVNHLSAAAAIDQLRIWHRSEPNADITIIFNSPGGSVIDGMALFDELVTLSLRGGGTHKVTTVVRGYAASMAGILLQAGDVRLCGAESYILIHEVSAGTGGKLGVMEDDVKFYKKMCERVADIFLHRSNGKCSKAVFQKGWSRADWWLDSEQALNLGFVDDIA